MIDDTVSGLAMQTAPRQNFSFPNWGSNHGLLLCSCRSGYTKGIEFKINVLPYFYLFVFSPCYCIRTSSCSLFQLFMRLRACVCGCGYRYECVGGGRWWEVGPRSLCICDFSLFPACFVILCYNFFPRAVSFDLSYYYSIYSILRNSVTAFHSSTTMKIHWSFFASWQTCLWVQSVRSQ